MRCFLQIIELSHKQVQQTDQMEQKRKQAEDAARNAEQKKVQQEKLAEQQKLQLEKQRVLAFSNLQKQLKAEQARSKETAQLALKRVQEAEARVKKAYEDFRACQLCNGKDHDAKACPKVLQNTALSGVSKSSCQMCGDTDHKAKACYLVLNYTPVSSKTKVSKCFN